MMTPNEQATVKFIRATCGSSGEGTQRCDVCGSKIGVGDTYIRRVLLTSGNVRTYCTDCERFRLVDLPIMPESVEPQPFLP